MELNSFFFEKGQELCHSLREDKRDYKENGAEFL
jgi:hypothetical protein